MEDQTPPVEASDPIAEVRSVALARINPINAGLAELSTKFSNAVFDVKSTKGMEEAKKARQEIREPRFKLEHIRKATASALDKVKKEVNETAESIKNQIMAIETPIHEQIVAEETRKENEKAAAAKAEQDRIDNIRRGITAISSFPSRIAAGVATSEQIAEELTVLAASEPLPDFYEEFFAEAVHTFNETKAAVEQMLKQAKEREEEQAKLRAEAAKAKELQAEMEALRAQLAAAEKARAEAGAKSVQPVVGAAPVISEEVQAQPGRLPELADDAGVEVVEVEDTFVQPAAAETVDIVGAIANLEPPLQIEESFELTVQPPAFAAPAAPAVDPEVSAAVERLFVDQEPTTDRVIAAVATHFGVDDETAKTYIIAAGEELAFEAA